MNNQIDHPGRLGTLKADEVVSAAKSAQLHDSRNMIRRLAKHHALNSRKSFISIAEISRVRITNKPAYSVLASRPLKILPTQEPVQRIQVWHFAPDRPCEDTARNVAAHKVRHDARLSLIAKPLREPHKARPSRMAVRHNRDVRPLCRTGVQQPKQLRHGIAVQIVYRQQRRREPSVNRIHRPCQFSLCCPPVKYDKVVIML